MTSPVSNSCLVSNNFFFTKERRKRKFKILPKNPSSPLPPPPHSLIPPLWQTPLTAEATLNPALLFPPPCLKSLSHSASRSVCLCMPVPRCHEMVGVALKHRPRVKCCLVALAVKIRSRGRAELIHIQLLLLPRLIVGACHHGNNTAPQRAPTMHCTETETPTPHLTSDVSCSFSPSLYACSIGPLTSPCPLASIGSCKYSI